MKNQTEKSVFCSDKGQKHREKQDEILEGISEYLQTLKPLEKAVFLAKIMKKNEDQCIIESLTIFLETKNSRGARDFVTEMCYVAVMEVGECTSECLRILNKVGMAVSLWHEGKAIKEIRIDKEKAEVLN